jgi:hypothetical protein
LLHPFTISSIVFPFSRLGTGSDAAPVVVVEAPGAAGVGAVVEAGAAGLAPKREVEGWAGAGVVVVVVEAGVAGLEPKARGEEVAGAVELLRWLESKRTVPK